MKNARAGPVRRKTSGWSKEEYLEDVKKGTWSNVEHLQHLLAKEKKERKKKTQEKKKRFLLHNNVDNDGEDERLTTISSRDRAKQLSYIPTNSFVHSSQ